MRPFRDSLCHGSRDECCRRGTIGPADAQQTFPTKTVRIVVPFTPRT